MLTTTYDATQRTRLDALLKIKRELLHFADRPDLCQPRHIAADIEQFLAAERALEGGKECVQIGYFSASQIGALATLRHHQQRPLASLTEAYGELVALTRDLSEHTRHNRPQACSLSTLLSIAATAQRAAEDCGLLSRFSSTPTNPLTA